MLFNYDVKVLFHIQSYVHELVHVIVRKQRVLLTNFMCHLKDSVNYSKFDEHILC